MRRKTIKKAKQKKKKHFNQVRVSTALYWYLHKGVIQLKCHLKWVDSSKSTSTAGKKQSGARMHRALFVHGAWWAGSSASPVTVCWMETFWNKEVRMLIKAGSTNGLAGSWGQADRQGPLIHIDSYRQRVKNGVSKCKYSIFTICCCY